jgi:ABC-type branched-subunit amino acid transport system substrate-binding protein
VFDDCGAATLKQNPQYPYVPAGESASIGPLPNVIAPTPIRKGWSSTPYVWLKAKFGKAAIEKTAALWANSPVAPLDSLEIVNAAASVGFKYVYQRSIGITETNFTSDILRMKTDGVQIVDLTLFNIAELGDFLQQASQQGFHPQAIIDGSSYDSSLFKLVGSADLSNLYFPLSYTDFLNPKPSVPEVSTMVSWTRRVHPGATINLFTLTAWEAGLLFQSAMKSAGSTPTQSGLLAALKSTTSFNAKGLTPTNNPAKGIPSACAVIVNVHKGTFKRLQPPKSGYDCSGKFVPYTGG